jgi:hypothetical protein
MSEEKKDAYADGKRDTQIKQHSESLSEHGMRLSRLERIVYGGLSIFGFLTYWPTIQKFMGGGGD